MKHLLSYVLLLSIATPLLSQSDSSNYNLLSKRGFYYFPEKGDWSISISATPFFSYLGDVFGDKTYNYNYYSTYNNSFYSSYQYPSQEESPSFAFTAQNPGTLFLKYYNEDNKAIRMKFLIGYSSSKINHGTGRENPDEIYTKSSALAIGLFLGQEFYLPIKSRIRGYYGYEAGLFSAPYVERDPDYPEYIIEIGKVEHYDESNSNQNYTHKGGNTFGLSANALLGAEWFFAPKISLGGEFGVGFNYAKMGKRKEETSGNNIISNSGGSSFEFAPFASGDLILHIYF